MEKYTAKFLRIGRQNWKKSFMSFIEKKNNVNNAIEGILDKYIYYSKSLVQIKHRIRRIFRNIEEQLESMPSTRGDLDKKKLKEIKILLNRLRKEIAKLKE